MSQPAPDMFYQMLRQLRADVMTPGVGEEVAQALALSWTPDLIQEAQYQAAGWWAEWLWTTRRLGPLGRRKTLAALLVTMHQEIEAAEQKRFPNTEEQQKVSLKTPVGLLSFPALFKPRAPAPGAEPRYSLNLVFDPEAQKTPEFLALKRAVMDVIEGELGATKAKDKATLASLRLPFRDAGEKAYAGYLSGHIYISAWSKDKPGLVNARVQEILLPEEVWPGQLARCTVRPFWFSTSGNRGVSFGLNNVQIVRSDMPRLDGRKKATDDFDTVDGGGVDDDSVPF